MASRRTSSSLAQQASGPDPVEEFRATVAPRSSCGDCQDSLACYRHALQSAVAVSDAMTDAFRDSAPQAVEAERIPGLEQALRSVQALVRASADVLGELDEVPGAVLHGLALQVDALIRGVLR